MEEGLVHDTVQELNGSVRAWRERDREGFRRKVQSYRDALLRYLNHTSLRQAAREVGMSPTGLSKFCDGAEPYDPTVLKLREWYAAHAQARVGGESCCDPDRSDERVSTA